MRIYKTAKGFWTLYPAIHHSPGHWHVAFARWVFTTEPE